jgi:hypothetical protein
MSKAVPPKVQRFPAGKQRRLDQLLEKNNEGTLTEKQKTTLEAEQLMVANARRLAEFSKREAVRPPEGAIPVTVWVQPQPGEQ